MIIGKIVGKTTTTKFEFEVVDLKHARKFSFVQVFHPDYDKFVLAQIYELIRSRDNTIAKCHILGIKENSLLTPITIPLAPGSEVMLADKETLEEFFLVGKEQGLFLGTLENSQIPIYLDMKKVLSKHVSILAKTGSGKSYTAAVIVEELLEKNVPVVIIDPHGEYYSLKIKNNIEEELNELYRLGLKERSYEIIEFGNDLLIPRVKALRLSPYINMRDVPFIFPKLSPTQQQLIYGLFKEKPIQHINDLIISLELEESNAKWSLLNYLHFLKSLHIFDEQGLRFKDLVKPGVATIINLRGYNKEIQEIIAYKIISELFELRKQNKVLPFFLLIEEVHNFAPERSFGEAKTSKILRTIASEGRKFGISLGLITQRPARLDKNVLSQAHTNIILKITNPNDLSAISSALEGVDEFFVQTIKTLPLGHLFISGLFDVPIKIKTRPRKSLHGGATLLEVKRENHNNRRKSQELIIQNRLTLEEFSIMKAIPLENVKKILVPCYLVDLETKEGEIRLLFEGIEGNLLEDIENFKTKKIPNLKELSVKELRMLKEAFKRKKFSKKGLLQLFPKEEEVFNKLLSEGYFIEEKGIFLLNPDYIFTKLSKFKISRNAELREVDYDFKEEYKVGEEKIKEMLKDFGKVKNILKVYVIRYKAD